MRSVKQRTTRLLPRRLTDKARPYYRMMRRMFKRGSLDGPSLLAIGEYGKFDVAYRKNTADEAVIKHSFDNDIFFSDVPEYEPSEGHVIIDIGAHIGTFSLLASSKVGKGKVYAVEASENSFNLLRINVALNRCSNVSIHHVAMADKDGISTLYHNAGNWGHSTVEKLSTSSETVRACSLSGFWRDNQIDECHFMKLNCEGAEFPILLNAPQDLLQRVGLMLVLYHCDCWKHHTAAQLIEYLESSGFCCDVRADSPQRGRIIASRPGPRD